MTTVVQVENLRKSYGAKVAVADVSFAVERGEIFGILGRNGAGKTTSVETLAGLRRADGGSVRVLGVDPRKDPQAIRTVVGVQLQEARLPARITVIEALHLFASFYPDPADPEELLGMLGLTEHRGKQFAKLSGGLKQRLSIALALVGNPQVAILDELTTGLDPQARREVWDLVERVRDSGVTIILVTHFMDEAERLCDRLVVIDEGRVVAAGSPAELIRGGNDERTFRMRLPDGAADQFDLIGSLADVHTVIAVEDEVEVTGSTHVLPAVILALAESGIVPDEIRTMTRTLEDVFVDVTGHAPEEELAA
ncbi:ABC transporter ATP-binding protein [Occultella glacieicola]|uniref:ABC transporter ATP-binding protein n=1 Tax=Occultella glacieicola TaxID=2518684 RepID=A0ABY2E1I4_9MICO|nr:ABC transporter ATP-binding protein [Occultella glacieicola]TDE88275.1 ABC transporter ATP-binding protein [Occultella glacieicola]